MADRIPGLTEEERDLLPASLDRGNADHVEAYPSYREFVDTFRTNRIFGSLVVGSLCVAIGVLAGFVGDIPHALLFLGSVAFRFSTESP